MQIGILLQQLENFVINYFLHFVDIDDQILSAKNWHENLPLELLHFIVLSLIFKN
jgi:hypothetical protein